MSMPSIEIQEIELENAINNIIASIALEEAGLAHILNAEGEKIEKALEMAEEDPSITIEQLKELNDSVAALTKAAAALETAMADKLEALVEFLAPPQEDDEEDDPPTADE